MKKRLDFHFYDLLLKLMLLRFDMQKEGEEANGCSVYEIKSWGLDLQNEEFGFWSQPAEIFWLIGTIFTTDISQRIFYEFCKKGVTSLNLFYCLKAVIFLRLNTLGVSKCIQFGELVTHMFSFWGWHSIVQPVKNEPIFEGRKKMFLNGFLYRKFYFARWPTHTHKP